MSQRKCLSCSYFDRSCSLSCAHRDSLYCASSPKKPLYLKKKTTEEKLSPNLKRLLDR